MPIYEYKCTCGRVETRLFPFGKYPTVICPNCGRLLEKIMSVPAPAVIHERERLPLGNKSRGRFISSRETGGLPILIPSYGALEKEEVDYVADEAIAQEKERVKKAEPRLATVALNNVVTETMKAPKGKRKKTLERITKEGMR